MTKKDIDNLSYNIIGAAIEVHKAMGPGLLESVYHKCMMMELKDRGIPFNSEIIVPIEYKNLKQDSQLRCDLFVANCIPVELKSVDAFVPVYEAQILTYMKFLLAPKGILINFNCVNLFKEGQKTFVNHLYRNLKDS